MRTISDAPYELADAVREFWPPEEWNNAVSIAYLESGWDAFAVNDSVDSEHPCGTVIRIQNGVAVAAERSVGFFQINSCNFPSWEWQRLYNARHNAGTAHLLWVNAGMRWSGPWFFSAQQLGLD